MFAPSKYIQKIEFMLFTQAVVVTVNVVIVLQSSASNCSKMRAARAARLNFLVQLIKILINFVLLSIDSLDVVRG